MYRIIPSVLTLALAAVLGCSSRPPSDPQTLTVALSSKPQTLDPRFATDANGMRIANLLFNSIVRLGPELKIIGDGASSWTYENLVYTFHLRPNLTFSNGQAVSSEDLKFTFEQFQSDTSPFHSALAPIENVSVTKDVDHFVLKLKLRHFSATLLTDLSPVKILPKKIVEAAGDDFGKNPIGTGSYIFVKQTPGELVLKSNKNHAFAVPKLDKLVFKIIKDDNTRYLKVLKGKIDIAQSEISPSKILALVNNDRFVLHKYPGLAMSYLLLNLKDPTLSQIKVRKALAHSIRRDEIIKYKLEGLATPATSILTPGNPFHNKSLIPIPFDIEIGKALIKEFKLQGHEFTLKTSNNQMAVENGKVLAKQMEAIGIKVKLQSFEWGTFYGDIKKGNFQLATMRWVGATDPDIYRIAFHSAEHPPGRNRGFYSNPKLDTLLDEGLKIEDVSQRIAHYNKVQAIVLKDLPIIPLWYNTQVAVINRRIKGYVPPQNGDFSPFINVIKE